MLSVPVVADSAVHRAPKLVTSPVPPSSFFTIIQARLIQVAHAPRASQRNYTERLQRYKSRVQFEHRLVIHQDDSS